MHPQSSESSNERHAGQRQSHHEYLFLLGIALGTALGFVLGSIIALRVGEERVEEMRRALERVIGRDDQPKFEFLLQ
jgi:hypothetical protein